MTGLGLPGFSIDYACSRHLVFGTCYEIWMVSALTENEIGTSAFPYEHALLSL